MKLIRSLNKKLILNLMVQEKIYIAGCARNAWKVQFIQVFFEKDINYKMYRYRHKRESGYTT